MLLATRVLSRWRAGRMAPFPIADDDCLDAFYVGSIGPDVGYFPGSDVVFAELAHYVSAADLARALVHGAHDDCGRAFAWGWATHVLADIWIHPLVNRSVGRRVARGGSAGISYAVDPVTHVRVELGLDACYARGSEVPRRIGRLFLLDSRGINLVADAYDETYRIWVDRRRLSASYRNAIRLLPGVLTYERMVAAAMRGGAETSGTNTRAGLVLVPLRAASWLLPRGCAAYGVLRPYPPETRLVEEVDSVLDTFADRFHVQYDMGLADLPQYNLDTGIDEGHSPDYPLTLATLDTLDRLRSGLPP